MDDRIFSRIVEFVYKVRWKYIFQLTRQTTLADDLGIDGDDAYEFFDAFMAEFKIDLSTFDLRKYFNEEGFGINVSRMLYKYPPFSPHKLNLGDLERAIEKGRWIDPPDA